MGLAAALLTALISLFLHNRYTSMSTLLPQQDRGRSEVMMGLSALGGGAGGVLGGLGGLGSGDDLANVDILQSRWLETRLLQAKYSFEYKTWYFGSPKQVQSTLYDFLEPKDLDQALKTVDKWISVSRDIKSGLITLTIDAPSPQLAQEMSANALQYLDEFLEQKTQADGAKRAKFYQDRVADAQAQSLASEQDLARFAGRNLNYQSSLNPEVRLEGLRLEADLLSKRQLVASMNLSLQQAMVDESNAMPVLSVLDPPNLPNRKSGPSRSLLVLVGFLMVAMGSWLSRNWRWLASRVDALEPAPGPGEGRGSKI
jgi:uncharacterized protein involved in exopolysaccharide biosynthesis